MERKRLQPRSWVNVLRREVLPLYMTPEGSTVRVVRILGGRGLVRRLHEFGILPGTILYVVKTIRPGPAIVEFKGSRLALGYGIAMRILVEVVST